MCQGEPDFTFPLNRLFHIFLYHIFLYLSIDYSLYPQHAWALWVFYRPLYKKPHPFAFFPLTFLLDCGKKKVLCFAKKSQIWLFFLDFVPIIFWSSLEQF
jgi:hypothetical protein